MAEVTGVIVILTTFAVVLVLAGWIGKKAATPGAFDWLYKK